MQEHWQPALEHETQSVKICHRPGGRSDHSLYLIPISYLTLRHLYTDPRNVYWTIAYEVPLSRSDGLRQR